MVSLPDKTKVHSFFADNFMGTDQDVKELDAPRPETRWCLVELPQKDIETLCNGSTFYFQSHEGGVGLEDGGAALSTETQTFSLEFLENSNSLFLAQVLEDPAAAAAAPAAGEAPAEAAASSFRCEVFGQVRGQLLTKPSPVNQQRLAALLAEQVLGAEPKEPRVTTDVLAYELAASPTELKALLAAGPFVEVEGLWRTLPAALEREILDTAVNVVTAKAWDHQDLDREALLAEVQKHLGEATVPTWSVLEKALASVRAVAEAEAAAPAGGEGGEGGQGGEGAAPEAAKEPKKAPKKDAFALDKAKLGSFQAMQLLRTPAQQVRDRFGLPTPQPPPKRARHGPGPGGAGRDAGAGPALLAEELATAYQEIAGLAEKPSTEDVMKLLGDQAYIDEFEGSLHLLDAAALPLEPRERLKRLFALQSHWNQGRLARLIAPTLGAGVKVDTWVLKQTRAVFVELTPGKEERFLTKKFAM